MKLSGLIAVLAFTTLAQANDGGMAAIKVSEIKMREYGIKNNERVIKKRITNPDFEITIKGSEARKLQMVLPSTSSVITAIQPELAEAYKESFKALGIYSHKSEGASSKIVSISCRDADEVVVGEKVRIVKRKPEDATCTITINGSPEHETPEDYFGDMMPFEPKVCKE